MSATATAAVVLSAPRMTFSPAERVRLDLGLCSHWRIDDFIFPPQVNAKTTCRITLARWQVLGASTSEGVSGFRLRIRQAGETARRTPQSPRSRIDLRRALDFPVEPMDPIECVWSDSRRPFAGIGGRAPFWFLVLVVVEMVE